MNNLKAIILAAGEGKRMKSKHPKVLHEIFNVPMLEWVIKAAKAAGALETAVIVGHMSDEVMEKTKGENIKFFLQEQQLGTGHAVMQAIDFLEDDEDILVLYGDTPLITGETLRNLVAFHKKENNGVSIISAVVNDSTGYGHIIRDENGNFLKNVEYKDANAEEKLVNEINTGVYCFKSSSLKSALGAIDNNNAQGEYYLPDTLKIILGMGESVNAMQTKDVSEFFGVNSRMQLAEAEKIMRQKINMLHMENGVTLLDPDGTYIGADVEIGCDTIILPGVILEGKTIIGEDCKIGPNSRLTNTVVGTGTTIQYTTAIESEIGDSTTVGPYAYIRPNSKIGNHVKIGDFVEVKNSNIGDDTKVSHLTYIGDSDVGQRINFGCGTVTVNYDGAKKYRTIIEDDVFIGCNANLIAPVTLKKGAYVAAGSTITKNVPEDSLAVGRARQENIKGWIKKH